MNTKLPPPGCYWGGATQPFWHPGANHTVDVALFKDGTDPLDPLVLLIRRNSTARAEAGKWAFPGGFIDTSADIGAPFTFDLETPRGAALRETLEETGAGKNIDPAELVEVGTYQGCRRDPQDNTIAWSCSHAFAFHAHGRPMRIIETGADDAAAANWVPLSKALGLPLAFDHSRILRDACAKLGVKIPEIILR